MGLINRKILYWMALTGIFAGSAFASPLNSKLLPLVPAGAEIVAGFENYQELHRNGQLVLSTHNNRLDLDDWQSLAGVDSRRVFDEVIEVAASQPGRGTATEHLIMVAGHFDRDRIYGSAELNGAQKTDYEGHTVMIIEPFEREKTEIQSERWLVILDNRIGILGTPFLVKSALHRYLLHTDIDMPLMERISQLRRDDTSWSVLLWPPGILGSGTAAQPGNAWRRLLEGADVMMVGARFGSKVRIEFLLRAGNDRGTKFFRQKAELFAEVFSRDTARPRRMNDVLFNPDRVEGSVQLSSKDFEEWGRQANRPRVYPAPRSRSNGE